MESFNWRDAVNAVSTHSRLKAAEDIGVNLNVNEPFQHTAA